MRLGLRETSFAIAGVAAYLLIADTDMGKKLKSELFEAFDRAQCNHIVWVKDTPTCKALEREP